MQCSCVFERSDPASLSSLTSDAHIEDAFVLSSTSPGPGTGTGKLSALIGTSQRATVAYSLISALLSPRRTHPFIVFGSLLSVMIIVVTEKDNSLLNRSCPSEV